MTVMTPLAISGAEAAHPVDTVPCTPGLRADARRNRERVLEAAAVVFAERGLDASLDEIARRAGVGVGTLYRRFPTREALIEALFDAKAERVIAVFDAVATSDGDPLTTLTDTLVSLAEVFATDRGVREVLLTSKHACAGGARIRERVTPVVAQLLQRAQDAGQVRADLELSDLPIILSMIESVADRAGTRSPELWRRYLTLLIDGLRTDGGAPTVLPVAALPEDLIDDVMCVDEGWRR
jgi:AcrR family transcriptional regulator